MRTPQLVPMMGALVLSCGEDTRRTQKKKVAVDDQVIDEDSEVGAGGTQIETGGEGEGEGEGEIGDDGLLGDPVAGEAFQFVAELDCDFRWALEGEIVACEDCEMAFDLTLERSAAGSCAGGEDRSGRMVVRNARVYFEADPEGSDYWGYVFAAGGGYLSWNTLGYIYGDQTYYYLGRLTY